MVTWYVTFLAVLALERIVELIVSRRHAAWAFAHGGVEVGKRHFLFMTLLHTAFFLAAAAEVVWLHRPFLAALGIPMALLVVFAQALRYWVILSLGPRWNVRIIVIPGQPVVTSGPYRYLRHPNYLAVIVEGIAIPLVHSAWLTAIGFSTLNALLLAVRIRCEEQALARYCGYHQHLGNRRRLLPAWRPAAAGDEG
jgi:methyltransferase